MKTLVLRRVVEAFFTIIIATFIVFNLLYFSPSDPITLLLDSPGDIAVDREIMETRIQEEKKLRGLDKTMLEQYFVWLKNIMKADLGNSIVTNQKVSDEIFSKLPNTILLAIISSFIQLVISIILAVVSVLNISKFWDHVVRIVSVVITSLPSFAVSIVILSYFSTKLYIYEISTSSNISRIWLPAITAGIVLTPKLVRVIRASLLDEMGKTYIVSAIARGLSVYHILKHALLNSYATIVTLVTLSLAYNVGGLIITESIFSWQGIGKYAMDSVLNQDYTAIQGYTLIVVVMVVTINLLADIITIVLQPPSNRNYML